MKLIGRFLKNAAIFIALGLVMVVYILSFASKDPKTARNLIWTDKAIELYNKNPKDFKVYYIKTYNKTYMTEDGKFAVSAVRYIPSLIQWQATIRYNNSTLARLAEDLNLDEAPGGEVFTYTLVDNTGRRYTDFKFLKTVKGRYNYYRLVFDNVNMSDVEWLKISIYYNDDILDGSYAEVPYSELYIYKKGEQLLNYTKAGKELFSDNQPTAGLLDSTGLQSGKD